ncbi:leucyl/phenylalanyl-tRNA--protein transferase [Flavobacterium ardleyense]|uniref:leucyl/phenylalanyl-tRNA--protein transferase n=1 Tax=Flavobacterium ardleyense TaxID=2038737 RepID=UPI00298C6284|nr:leucyl/phenylalanyl-tRNA--protein transferase [Flavobacterium ardleyense]
MFYLGEELYFPPLSQTHPTGIVAFGGDLSLRRLELAYRSGIFPWFEDGEPITWYSPAERMVLFFEDLKVSKSLKKIIDRKVFEITFNTAFREVITNCQEVKRSGQLGTWITDDMIHAYCKLHEAGMAQSVEVWENGQLVGGLYGIDLGHIFCGESMFSLRSNASKVAFVHLVEKLKEENYLLLDCQVFNPHLESLGAVEIDRDDFLMILKSAKKL